MGRKESGEEAEVVVGDGTKEEEGDGEAAEETEVPGETIETGMQGADIEMTPETGMTEIAQGTGAPEEITEIEISRIGMVVMRVGDAVMIEVTTLETEIAATGDRMMVTETAVTKSV